MMRSYLFVPADSERKLAKGSESGADALILDLEDSVAEARRPLARDSARAYIEAARGGPQLYVRINALASGAALDDLAVVMRARPHGIMLPKCVPNDVRTLDAYLSAFEAAGGHPAGATQIVAIATETPASLFALHDYRGASARLEALTWGAEDLAAALGSENRLADGTYGDVFRLARSLCVVAAGAAEVAAIDTVFTDFKDERGLEAESRAARREGFAGKMAIHPAQVPIINAAFTATPQELHWAKAVIEAFERAPDAGTVAIDGKMIDRPHLTLARRWLGAAR